MDIVAPHLRRALEYVQILEREGYRPSMLEVDRFITTKPPKESWSAERHFRETFLRMQGLLSSKEPEMPEKVARYMVDLGWLSGDSDHVGLSDLGTALLSAVQREPFGEQALQVTLRPSDPLVYLKLTQVLGGCGDDALLADAYFKHESLWWLINNTAIRRVLVKELKSGSSKKDLQELRLTLGNLNPVQPVEVRSTTGGLHDRCLIPRAGNVTVLGTSIRQVGTTLTVATEVQEEPSNAYRELYEKLWETGTVLEPETPTSPPPSFDAESSESDSGSAH